ncbi:unnamed protein product [Urochloa decumbens]|uniref:Uncharacterized protein n=1 Tax=Urochloa decumbens TaxID=240449 RepID=A0ABC8XUE6_9POAL
MSRARPRTRADWWWHLRASTALGRSADDVSTLGTFSAGTARRVSSDSAMKPSSATQSSSALRPSPAAGTPQRSSTTSPLALRIASRRSAGSAASIAASTRPNAEKKGFQRRRGLCPAMAAAAVAVGGCVCASEIGEAADARSGNC